MNIQYEYPLQWIPKKPRTQNKATARFKSKSASYSGDKLANELKLLGAKNIIISSNMRIKSTGGFYAQQKVDDTGIVCYFDLKGAKKGIALDLYKSVEDNMWALCLSISAIRGIERWGGAQILDGLFTGFTALPPPEDIASNQISYFSDCINKEHARERYLKLAKELHPDLGGKIEEFQEMKRQYESIQ